MLTEELVELFSKTFKDLFDPKVIIDTAETTLTLNYCREDIHQYRMVLSGDSRVFSRDKLDSTLKLVTVRKFPKFKEYELEAVYSFLGKVRDFLQSCRFYDYVENEKEYALRKEIDTFGADKGIVDSIFNAVNNRFGLYSTLDVISAMHNLVCSLREWCLTAYEKEPPVKKTERLQELGFPLETAELKKLFETAIKEKGQGELFFWKDAKEYPMAKWLAAWFHSEERYNSLLADFVRYLDPECVLAVKKERVEPALATRSSAKKKKAFAEVYGGGGFTQNYTFATVTAPPYTNAVAGTGL